jgi:hypothetical protein
MITTPFSISFGQTYLRGIVPIPVEPENLDRSDLKAGNGRGLILSSR